MSTARPAESAAPAGPRLMDLFGRQLGLYRRLEQLADVQRKVIEIDDTRPLLQLLSERQKLTTALAELNAEITPYRERWSEVRQTLSAADGAALDGLVRETGDRLRRILENDAADTRLLAAKKNRMAQSLGELETGRRTLSAYGGATVPRAPLLDETEA